jgi:hypothetical protein
MKDNLPGGHTCRNSPFDKGGEGDFQIPWFFGIRRNLVAKFFMFDLFHLTSHSKKIPCA